MKLRLHFYITLTALQLFFFSRSQAQCFQYNGPLNGENQASYTSTLNNKMAAASNGVIYLSYTTSFSSNPFVVTKFDGSTWSAIDTSWFRGKNVVNPILKLDNNENPVLIYSSSTSKISVARYNGVQWDTLGNQGFITGMKGDIAFDNSNVPYIAVQDFNNGNKLSVMKFTAGAWSYVGTPAFTPGEADYININLDASGIIYIAFRDEVSKKATMMMFDGVSWINVGTGSMSPGNAWYIDMAIDNNGKPYIAFTDSTNSQKASVMSYDGAAWNYVGASGITPTFSNELSLVIDTTGWPVISYGEAPYFYGYGNASVMRFDGSNWNYLSDHAFSQGPAYSTQLDVSPSGTLVVAINDHRNNRKPMVSWYDGTNWIAAGQSGISPGFAPYTSTAVDPSGNIYVAFEDMNNGSKVSVMVYNGTAWNYLGSSALSNASSTNIKLMCSHSGDVYLFYQLDGPRQINVQKYSGGTWAALPSPGGTNNTSSYEPRFSEDDTLYIAFSDTAHSNSVSVKKFNGTAWSYVGTPGFTPSSSFHPSMDISRYGSVFVSYEDLGNLYVARYDNGTWTFLPAMVAQSPYFSTIRCDNSGAHPYILVEGGPGGAVQLIQYEVTLTTLFTGGTTSGSNAVKHTDLIIDKYGNPYFTIPASFSPIDKKYRAVTYARLNGQNLNITSNTLVSSVGAFNYPNLAMDTTGNIYLGYQDGGAVVEKFNTMSIASGSVQSQHVCSGDTATFSITVNGPGPFTYQWQEYLGGSNYANLSNNTTYSGVTTPTLVINDATNSLSSSYRLVISNPCYSITASAGLHIETPYVSLNNISINDTLCITPNPYILNGAIPADGTFSGYNITDSLFTADSAGVFQLDYTYTNSYGCTSKDSMTVVVQHASIVATYTPPSCGDTTSLTLSSNGTAPFIYTVDATQQSTNFFPGLAGGQAYNVCITDSFGCNECTSIALGDSCDLVWPGDANDDLTADNLDILAIAVGNGTVSHARSTTDITWSAFPSVDWTQALAGTSNYKHIDCNGDGTVNLADTLAVIQNFGLTHPASRMLTVESPESDVQALSLKLNLVEDSLAPGMYGTVEILLGESSLPANNIYGIAFTLNFDASVFVPSASRADGFGSWLGNAGSNLVTIALNDGSTGNAQCAITRYDHTNNSGFGLCGHVNLQVSQAAAINQQVVVAVSNIVVIDNLYNITPLQGLSDSLYITNAVVGINEQTSDLLIMQPNPAKDYFTVYPTQANAVVNVFDLSGQKILSQNCKGTNSRISTEQLAAGVYMVEITELANQKSIYKRLVISR